LLKLYSALLRGFRQFLTAADLGMVGKAHAELFIENSGKSFRGKICPNVFQKNNWRFLPAGNLKCCDFRICERRDTNAQLFFNRIHFGKIIFRQWWR
jgi:hypothetical protein